MRHELCGLESVNRKSDLSETPDPEHTHILVKDIVQATELMRVAVSAVKTLQHLHKGLGASSEMDENKIEIMKQTDLALDYHRVQFENILIRTKDLLKRKDAQISLVCE